MEKIILLKLTSKLDSSSKLVSHDGAIKFLLQNWCKYDYNINSFIYNGDVIWNAKLESPSIIKLTFENDKLLHIEKI